MLKYELYKIFTVKTTVLLFIFLIANGVISYITADEPPADADEVNEYIALYEKNPTNFDELYIECLTKYSGEEPDSKYYAFAEAVGLVEYKETFSDDISLVLFRSNVYLSEAERGSYTEKYETNVIEKYTPISDMEFDISAIRGYDCFLLYDAENIFIILFAVVFGSYAVINDREASMEPILNTCRKGKGALVFVKAAEVLILTSAATVLFSAVSLLFIFAKCGLSGADTAIQMIAEFEYCPYMITVGQYALIRLVCQLIGTWLAALFAMFISSAFSSYIVTFVAEAALFGAGFAYSSIADILNNSFLSIFDFYLLIDSGSIFERYLCVDLLGFPVGLIHALVFSSMLFGAVFFTGSTRLSSKPQFIAVCATNTLTKVNGSKSGCRTGLFCYEIHKLLPSGVYVVPLILLLLFKLFYLYVTLEAQDNDMIYKEYADAFCGEYTDATETELLLERIRLDSVLSQKDIYASLYINGEIDESEYREFMASYWKAYASDSVFSRVEEYGNYLSGCGEDMWLIYDTGYNLIFDSNVDWILSAALFIIEYRLFYGEKKTKMYELNFTTPKGRGRIFGTKLLLSALLSVIVSLVFVAFDMAFINQYFPITNGFSAPLQSLMMFGDVAFNLTIGEFLALYIILKIVSFVLFGFLSALAGHLFSSFPAVMLSISFVVVLPHLSAVYILEAGYFDLINYLSVSPIVVLTGNITFLILWFVLTFLMFLMLFISYKRYYSESAFAQR